MVSIKKINGEYLVLRNCPGTKKPERGIEITEEDYTFKVKIFGSGKRGYIFLGDRTSMQTTNKLIGKKIRLKMEIVD